MFNVDLSAIPPAVPVTPAVPAKPRANSVLAHELRLEAITDAMAAGNMAEATKLAAGFTLNKGAEPAYLTALGAVKTPEQLDTLLTVGHSDTPETMLHVVNAAGRSRHLPLLAKHIRLAYSAADLSSGPDRDNFVIAALDASLLATSVQPSYVQKAILSDGRSLAGLEHALTLPSNKGRGATLFGRDSTTLAANACRYVAALHADDPAKQAEAANRIRGFFVKERRNTPYYLRDDDRDNLAMRQDLQQLSRIASGRTFDVNGAVSRVASASADGTAVGAALDKPLLQERLKAEPELRTQVDFTREVWGYASLALACANSRDPNRYGQVRGGDVIKELGLTAQFNAAPLATMVGSSLDGTQARQLSALMRNTGHPDYATQAGFELDPRGVSRAAPDTPFWLNKRVIDLHGDSAIPLKYEGERVYVDWKSSEVVAAVAKRMHEQGKGFSPAFDPEVHGYRVAGTDKNMLCLNDRVTSAFFMADGFKASPASLYELVGHRTENGESFAHFTSIHVSYDNVKLPISPQLDARLFAAEQTLSKDGKLPAVITDRVADWLLNQGAMQIKPTALSEESWRGKAYTRLTFAVTDANGNPFPGVDMLPPTPEAAKGKTPGLVSGNQYSASRNKDGTVTMSISSAKDAEAYVRAWAKPMVVDAVLTAAGGPTFMPEGWADKTRKEQVAELKSSQLAAPGTVQVGVRLSRGYER